MMQKYLLGLALLLAPVAAFANCAPTPILDGGGVSTNTKTALDGSSNCFGFAGIVDNTGANAYPAAAALGDTDTNPTSIRLGSDLQTWDATNSVWRRWPAVAGAGGAPKTDMSSIAGIATAVGNGTTNTGTQRVTISSDSTGQVALATGANSVGTVGLNTGANVVGKVGIDQTTLGTTNAVQAVPGATNGLSWYFVQPAASDNHVNIKNGAGNVYEIILQNNSATVNYMRLYNAGTGFNGCASATNLVTQIQIPAATSVGGIVIPILHGLSFSTGISICVTSGYATTDTTAATATAMSVNIGYK